MATFTFNISGTGCLVVSLITVPGSPALDTYTIDTNTLTPQTNVVSTATVKLLAGTNRSDLDGDRSIDLSDLTVMAGVYLQGVAPCP